VDHILICFAGCAVHKRTGDLCIYVTDVFAVPECQVSTGLAYLRPVACFTCQFAYAAFVVVLRCVVDFEFGQLLQCVCTFKGYLYVSLFEEVGYFSDFGIVISEGSPFIVGLLSFLYLQIIRKADKRGMGSSDRRGISRKFVQ